MSAVKVFLWGVSGAMIGFFIGLPIGVAIAVWGAERGIDKSWLYVVSFLTLGSFIVFFILPREQYYFWRKIKRDVLSQDGGLFDFAPASFFLGVGIGIGVRHQPF